MAKKSTNWDPGYTCGIRLSVIRLLDILFYVFILVGV
jgi:hypothetical protein